MDIVERLRREEDALDNEAADEIERLRYLLERAAVILGNMAAERKGAIFCRWPIHHEPLRADAQNLFPEICAALQQKEIE